MEKKSCPECDMMVTPLKDGGLRAHGPVHARCAQDPANRVATRICEPCGRAFVLTGANEIPRHGSAPGSECDAVSDPTPTVETMDDTKGPWFGALYEGRCSDCTRLIDEGDRIRADGAGGYECEDCGLGPEPLTYTDVVANNLPLPEGLADPSVPEISAERSCAVRDPECEQCHPDEFMGPSVREVTELSLPATMPDEEAFEMPTPVVEIRLPAAGPMPTPDEFMDPSGADGPTDELNVSGQPKARYEWRGTVNMGYLVKDPDAGDFRRYGNGKPKGWTRATTFNKAASDSKAINDWGKRNIVIGASRRRDVLLRAHGLTHENDRAALTGIVAELEEAAGAKVGSDLGTYLHNFTELMDAGLKTWREAPEEFQRSLALYAQALADAGLEPVPGLIERTTMISEFEGVVGTFDRIFYHRPSGTYLVGDLKTGKTMEYAMDETNTQMWIYAHGVNQNGIYDWNTDTWDLPWEIGGAEGSKACKVREDVGVIIHMPVQGPQAGTVSLVHADLQAGARHAELCHAIRSRDKAKVRAFTPPEPIPAPGPVLVNGTTPELWRALFRTVRSSEEATELWKRAKEDGVQGVFLNELIELAREAIRQHS